ncbi:dead deah box helicase domain-containing protein, partial [Cystoisospora suis]
MKKSIKSEVLHPPDPSLLSDHKRGEQDGFPSSSPLGPEKKKKRKYEHSPNVRRDGEVKEEERNVSEIKKKKKRYLDDSNGHPDEPTPSAPFSKKTVSLSEDESKTDSTRSSSSPSSSSPTVNEGGGLKKKEEKRHLHREDSTKKRRKIGEPGESAPGEQQDSDVDHSSESIDASSVSTPRDRKNPGGQSSSSCCSSASREEEEEDELASYQLSALSLKSLRDRGYRSLLPIQKAAFYPVLSGKDFIGRARTGTGKTIAFSLPLVEKLCSSSSSFLSSSDTSTVTSKTGDSRRQPSLTLQKKKEVPRILVLLPTRELAQQVYEEFLHLSAGRFTCVCLYGGSDEFSQLKVLRGGVSVVVACPGRFKDFMNRCGVIAGRSIDALVLDEGDRMLELGFREDIEEIFEWILAQKKEKEEVQQEEKEKEKKNTKKGNLQFLLFTATLPKWVLSLAERFMSPDRVLVDIVEFMKKKKREEQEEDSHTKRKGGEDSSSFLDCYGDGDPHKEPKNRLKDTKDEDEERKGGIDHLIVFCSWNTRVRILGDLISLYGHRYLPSSSLFSPSSSASSSSSTIIFAETKSEVNEISVNSSISSLCAPLHGDISQQQRETTLSSFKKKKFPCLVATDVAARGLHVDDLQLVIQTSPPRDIDTYIHRAGRTGRAGKKGTCITLCKISDIPFLRQIELEGNFTFRRIGVPQFHTLQRYHLSQYLQQIQSLPISPLISSSFSSSSSSFSDVDGRRSQRSGGSLKKKSSTVADELLLESARNLLERYDSPEEAIYRCLRCLLSSLPHPQQHRHASPSALSNESMVNGGGEEGEREKSSRSAKSGEKDTSTRTGSEEEEEDHAASSSVLSCLNGREGYKTFSLELKEKKGYRHPATIYSCGYIWRTLKEFLGEKKQHEVVEKFQSMTLYRNGRGCVFDVEHIHLPSFYRYILQAMKDKEDEEEIGKVDRRRRRKEGEENGEKNEEESSLDGGGNRYYPFSIDEVEDLPELYDGLQQLREEGTTKSSDSAYNGGKNPNHIWSRKLGEGRG